MLHRSGPAIDVVSLMLRALSQLGDVHCISILRTQTTWTDSALPDHRRSLADVPAGEVLRRAGSAKVHQARVRGLSALRHIGLRLWSRLLPKLRRWQACGLLVQREGFEKLALEVLGKSAKVTHIKILPDHPLSTEIHQRLWRYTGAGRIWVAFATNGCACPRRHGHDSGLEA
jgi:hypothetical protein